ncbi:MAG: glycerophosphoryl diester phosphodiesterase [Pseudonocardiales bacterium]|jgi:glycerophosphoryl diester phosphodiesterase|nr:glycerophosphoryl diester phosphodiesterase [Pseudonocardiales bacterium]
MGTVRPRAARVAVEPPTRPMLVAHRGASSQLAEHTLAAYEIALSSGADALECDVRMTRDGHLVCVHDRTINRTSDGRGVVSELDLPSLERLDFSSWHGDLPESADELLSDNPYLSGVVVDRVEKGGGVLTLELLLELVRDSQPEVRLLIETKHPTRYMGLVEKTLVELLDRFGWAGQPGPPETLREPANMDNRVIVMSFAPTAVRRVRLLAPEIPTVLLLERLMPQRRAGILPAGVPIAGPGLHVLRADPDFVARAHARGHQVYVWTVDKPEDVEFVLDLGVDTIITDHPSEVRALLDGR